MQILHETQTYKISGLNQNNSGTTIKGYSEPEKGARIACSIVSTPYIELFTSERLDLSKVPLGTEIKIIISQVQ